MWSARRQQIQERERGEAMQRRNRKRERGEVTTAVLAVPIAMLLILVVVQAALVFHAQAVLDAAAQDGAQAGQGRSGTRLAARTATQSVIGDSAGNLLSNVHIDIQTTPRNLAVRVRADVKSLIPGYNPTIESMSTGPREVFVAKDQR